MMVPIHALQWYRFADTVMIVDIVSEIAQCFEIEDEKIFEALINRSDKLQHFIQIYELKIAS